MGKIGIALLSGGWSAEREISLKSGESVYRAIDKRKYNVTLYDPRSDLRNLVDEKDKIDLAFIVLHGRFGEDGCIQGLLDLLGIRFVGSSVLSSAMAMNKKLAKELYSGRGLRVGKDIILGRGEDLSAEKITDALGLTTVVKPVTQGSSLGISVCYTKEELMAGIEKAFEYDAELMVEEYINGREVTCCVLGNRLLEVLPLVEIAPNTKYPFFNYEAKYTNGATQEICPAPLSPDLTKEVYSYAKTAHRALKCRVWSRTDMIIRDDTVYLLETNTIPGMTENSLFPLAARTAGLSFSELVEKLITLSLE